MNHLIASPPWFWPRSISICTHQRPEFGLSSVITTRPRCWSHFFMSPDSKLSANNTSGSAAMPASPGYFAARPEEMGGTGNPTGIAATTEPGSAWRLVEDCLTVSSGESPDATGGLPVPSKIDLLDAVRSLTSRSSDLRSIQVAGYSL